MQAEVGAGSMDIFPTRASPEGGQEALTAFRAAMNSSLEILWFSPQSTLPNISRIFILRLRRYEYKVVKAEGLGSRSWGTGRREGRGLFCEK